MRNNGKWIAGAAGLAVILGVLFYLPRIGKKSTATDVLCLVPNVPLVQHVHPVLKIETDGNEEAISGDIGLGVCERAIHTHDTSGIIHVEAQDRRQHTLNDFFSVWGRSIERKGYTVTITVDGAPSTNGGVFVLRDGQKIIISYVKKL